MDESSSSGTNLTNSLPSKVTSTTIHNVNVSFEKDYPLTEKFQKQIIKSIARILREIIKENFRVNAEVDGQGLAYWFEVRRQEAEDHWQGDEAGEVHGYGECDERDGEEAGDKDV